MRIAYGVHGYGRGHATRALALLPELGRRHEVRVFAGGDAFESLHRAYGAVQIPNLGYVYQRGRLSLARTLWNNLPLLADVVRAGRHTQAIMRSLRDFNPQVLLCDCEPLTARAAGLLGIPRVSLDHFGILARCRVDLGSLDSIKSLLDRTLYLAMFGRARHALISSFYDAPPRSKRVVVIGTLLRDEVRAVRPSDGGHLLVYFNRGAEQLTRGIAKVLGSSGREIRIYGSGRVGRVGNMWFRPTSDRGFLEDLAGARAVVGTAGNQLVGEALYFGKPLLVMPERSVEQRMNAAAIVRLGVGEALAARGFTEQSLAAFLDRVDQYVEKIARNVNDGREQALRTLETWFAGIMAEKAEIRMLDEVPA